MAEFGKISFSARFAQRLKSDLDCIGKDRRTSKMIKQTTGRFQSHGGCVSPEHVAAVVNLFLTPRFVRSDMKYIADFGCGVGQVVLTLAHRFGQVPVYGIDNDSSRLHLLRKRVEDFKDESFDFDNIIAVDCDWTKTSEDRLRWGFLDKVGFIFYNNINLSGDPDEFFERVVEKYVKPGTVIVCYERLFRGDRSHLVKETIHETTVDSDDFSWLIREKQIKLFRYERVHD